MSHADSRISWPAAVIGWAATEIILAFGICIFGSDDMTTAVGIVVNVLHQLLAVGVGYACGRRWRGSRKPEPVGFPVITKDRGDSTAG